MEHMIHIFTSSTTLKDISIDILTDVQRGFRKRRSCETQLIVTIHDIATKLAKGSQVNTVFRLDFSKVFDKVQHNRLLHKLEYYGVNQRKKRLAPLFSKHRMQRVVFDGTICHHKHP